jgi:hypothetical protein
MTQKPDRTVRKLKSVFAYSLTLPLVMALLLSGSAPVSYGYNADATTAITRLRTHSSFHYEMVRVLAVLAGFNKDEAEEIAVAGEAVDLGTFTGYRLSNGAKTITIGNTGRFGQNGLLYHFSRRSSRYEKADADGAQSNTCDYFKNGNPNNRYTAPCTPPGPELDRIRNWAFALDGPKPTKSQLPVDASGRLIAPKTLVALGIYLHSIGDTYSHEKCMIVQAFRFHKNQPPACNANWHNAPGEEFGDGTPFNKAAADEVWRALREYRGADGSNPPDFIKEFITKLDACERVKFAVDAFNDLTREKTIIRCSSSSNASQRSRRRG